MRTIKEDEELKTLVKVGDIVRLEGFTDDPIIAVVTNSLEADECYGCALGPGDHCAVTMRDNTGDTCRVSPCCLRASWMCSEGTIPIFGLFKELGKVLEDL